VKRWFVVAEGYHDVTECVVVVFGPFYVEVDARAYAMDVFDENGWTSVEAQLLTNQEVRATTKDPVIDPYEKEKVRCH
jgi:hypothetical protein